MENDYSTELTEIIEFFRKLMIIGDADIVNFNDLNRYSVVLEEIRDRLHKKG